MSAASSFITPFDDHRAASPTHSEFPLAEESSMQQPGRARSSFLDTIVGRHGGLRVVLSQVAIVAPTDAKPMKEMPALAEEYEQVKPEYKTLPGWCVSTYGVKDGEKLPKAALDYLRFISDFLQVEIGMISTGPERDATIVPAGTLLSRWL